MSEENVERVRAAYEHFNRTGEPPWDLFASGAEFDASNVAGFGSYDLSAGRERVLGLLREFAAAFEDWRIEPEEIIDAGEQVVAVVRDGGRLRETGDEVYNRFTNLWTFRSGMVTRWKTFTDRGQAFDAAGLSEPGT
jgi:ketosteroid isomerase-like protein